MVHDFVCLSSTPWGEMWGSNSSRSSATSIRSTSRAVTPAPAVGGGAEQLAPIPEGENPGESSSSYLEKKPELTWPSGSSISSVSSSELPPSLVDKVREAASIHNYVLQENCFSHWYVFDVSNPMFQPRFRLYVAHPLVFPIFFPDFGATICRAHTQEDG